MGNRSSNEVRRRSSGGSSSHSSSSRAGDSTSGSNLLLTSSGVGSIFGSIVPPTSNIDHLIRTGQLAPRAVVSEETGSQDPGVECPICFNTYFALNNMCCCNQELCTECFVALKAGKTKSRNGAATAIHCPYCDSSSFEVKYTPGPRLPSKSNAEGNSSCGDAIPTAAATPVHSVTTPAASLTPAPTSAPTIQKVVTNSVADRQELEAQIAKHREMDLMESQRNSNSYRNVGIFTGPTRGFHRGPRVSGGPGYVLNASRRTQQPAAATDSATDSATAADSSRNLPPDLLSISEYMNFYHEMRGSPAVTGGGGGTSSASSSIQGASGEVNSARHGWEDSSQPPLCPECLDPTVISSYSKGGYSNGLFICNICQSTRQCSDCRWFCQSCSTDFCFHCKPSHRSDLPSKPSPVPSMYESGGNLNKPSSGSSSGSSGSSNSNNGLCTPNTNNTNSNTYDANSHSGGARLRHRHYASRSSQQSGLLESLQSQQDQPAHSPGSASASASAPILVPASSSSQWDEESDLLEEMMLLEAIQLSLQTSSVTSATATATATEVPESEPEPVVKHGISSAVEDESES